MIRFSRSRCNSNFKDCTNSLVYIAVIFVIDVVLLFSLSTCYLLIQQRMLLLSRASEFRVAQVPVQLTGYAPVAGHTDDAPLITASGHKIVLTESGQLVVPLEIVAMSRELMKKCEVQYGDEIWLPFRVEDTTHPKTKGTVDVLFESPGAARQFGRREAVVLVLKK